MGEITMANHSEGYRRGRLYQRARSLGWGPNSSNSLAEDLHHLPLDEALALLEQKRTRLDNLER